MDPKVQRERRKQCDNRLRQQIRDHFSLLAVSVQAKKYLRKVTKESTLLRTQNYIKKKENEIKHLLKQKGITPNIFFFGKNEPWKGNFIKILEKDKLHRHLVEKYYFPEFSDSESSVASPHDHVTPEKEQIRESNTSHAEKVECPSTSDTMSKVSCSDDIIMDSQLMYSNEVTINSKNEVLKRKQEKSPVKDPVFTYCNVETALTERNTNLPQRKAQSGIKIKARKKCSIKEVRREVKKKALLLDLKGKDDSFSQGSKKIGKAAIHLKENDEANTEWSQINSFSLPESYPCTDVSLKNNLCWKTPTEENFHYTIGDIITSSDSNKNSTKFLKVDLQSSDDQTEILCSPVVTCKGEKICNADSEASEEQKAVHYRNNKRKSCRRKLEFENITEKPVKKHSESPERKLKLSLKALYEKKSENKENMPVTNLLFNNNSFDLQSSDDQTEILCLPVVTRKGEKLHNVHSEALEEQKAVHYRNNRRKSCRRKLEFENITEKPIKKIHSESPKRKLKLSLDALYEKQSENKENMPVTNLLFNNNSPHQSNCDNKNVNSFGNLSDTKFTSEVNLKSNLSCDKFIPNLQEFENIEIASVRDVSKLWWGVTDNTCSGAFPCADDRDDCPNFGIPSSPTVNIFNELMNDCNNDLGFFTDLPENNLLDSLEAEDDTFGVIGDVESTQHLVSDDPLSCDWFSTEDVSFLEEIFQVYQNRGEFNFLNCPDFK